MHCRAAANDQFVRSADVEVNSRNDCFEPNSTDAARFKNGCEPRIAAVDHGKDGPFLPFTISEVAALQLS